MSKKEAYRYSTEIGQMAYIYGRVKEADEEVVQYIEDIVRTQLTELVVQARTQAARRGSRALTVEDLVFLARHDTPTVNRLRTYLSWKDDRKKAKDDDADDDEVIDLDPNTGLKTPKLKMKIPWDVSNVYSEYVKDDEEVEDEDELATYEESKARLEAADELTRGMTKEQYQHYTDCRQASFTYKKSRRFREFLNISAFTDGNVSDEVLDVLGFFACDIVRSLCEAATSAKLSMAKSRTSEEDRKKQEEKLAKTKAKGKKRAVEQDDSSAVGGGATPAAETPAATIVSDRTTREASSSAKKVRKGESGASPRRVLYDPISLFSEPLVSVPSGMNTPRGGTHEGGPGGSGHLSPNTATFDVQDVNLGYVALQRGKTALKANGMKNWRAGGKRIKTGLV